MKSLLFLMLSTSVFADIKVFEPQTPVKASEVNGNFQHAKELLQSKNANLNFTQFMPGSVILKESLESEFQKVRDLGIFVDNLESEYIVSEELNLRFAEIIQGISLFDDIPIVNDSNETVLEDGILNDSFSFSNSMGSNTFSVFSPPSHGQVIITNSNYLYTPDPNYYGPDSFTVRLHDGTKFSSPANININVSPVNDNPVLSNLATINLMINAPVYSGSVSGFDQEGDNLTYSVVTNSNKGALSLSSNGSFTYTPNLNAYGLDSFVVRANDGISFSDNLTININIQGSGIVANAGVKTYFDGTVAKDCNEYLTQNNGNYKYEGATGDGIYSIRPRNSVPAFNTKCYMSTTWGLGTNMMRDGSLSSVAQANPSFPWINWNPAAINDNDDNSIFGLTGTDTPSVNINRGVQFNFNSPKAVKAIKLNTYFVNGAAFNIDYHNGSGWVTVLTVYQNEHQNGVFYFNHDGAISATSWRWYISSFPAGTGTNFYGREIRLYPY